MNKKREKEKLVRLVTRRQIIQDLKKNLSDLLKNVKKLINYPSAEELAKETEDRTMRIKENIQRTEDRISIFRLTLCLIEKENAYEQKVKIQENEELVNFLKKYKVDILNIDRKDIRKLKKIIREI